MSARAAQAHVCTRAQLAVVVDSANKLRRTRRIRRALDIAPSRMRVRRPTDRGEEEGRNWTIIQKEPSDRLRCRISLRDPREFPQWLCARHARSIVYDTVPLLCSIAAISRFDGRINWRHAFIVAVIRSSSQCSCLLVHFLFDIFKYPFGSFHFYICQIVC